MKSNILFLIPDLRQGGAESSLLEICKLLKKEVNIYILCLKKQGELVNDFEKNVKRIDYVTNSKINFILYNRFYKFFLNKNKSNKLFSKIYFDIKFDKIVSFLEGSVTKIVSDLNYLPKNKIAWIHTSLKQHNKEFNYENFNKVITCSQTISKELFFKNKETIYNLINLKKLDLLANENLNLPKNKFNIVSVGRFDKAKGFQRLIEISTKLISEGYDHNLYILGHGRLYKKLNKLAKIPNIKIITNEKNVYKYMKNADLFVLFSIYEGYGMVVDEAMHLNTPVAVTKTGSIEATKSKFGLECDNSKEGIYSCLKNILSKKVSIIEAKKDIVEQNEKIKKQLKSLFDV